MTGFVNIIQSDSTGLARSKLDDSLKNIVIRRDNAFLDPTLAARMDRSGLTQFTMGSFNLDMPLITTNNRREMISYAAGLEGNVAAFGSDWRWEVFGQRAPRRARSTAA